MTTSKPSKPKSKVQQIASSISSTTKVSAHDRQGTKGVTEHNRKKTQGRKDAELADRLLKNSLPGVTGMNCSGRSTGQTRPTSLSNPVADWSRSLLDFEDPPGMTEDVARSSRVYRWDASKRTNGENQQTDYSNCRTHLPRSLP